MKKSKKNNLNDKVFNILVVLLGIVTIILIVVVILNHNKPSESKLVLELHNYFSTDDLGSCEGFLNYASKKVEYDDIPSKAKLCLAYQKATIKNAETEEMKVDKKKELCIKNDMSFKSDDDDETKCTITKIKKDLLDNSYKKLYGKEIENNKSFMIDNLHICYLNDEYYYCGLSETFTYTLGSETSIYRVINKSEEKSSEVIIYDYFLKVNDNNCYGNYTTSTINRKCSDRYNKKKVNYRFLKKYGTEYRHIYKKAEDGTFYWSSSEPINK